MKKLIYEAFFLEEELSSKLEVDVNKKHCTTAFRPEKDSRHLYGTKVKLEISGYASTKDNEGYLVTGIISDNDEIRKLFNEVKMPHITLSLSNKGKAVDTGFINEWKSIDKFTVNAVFDGFYGS